MATDPTARTADPTPDPAGTAPAVPDRAHTVVVPLANPDTAPELLALARAVVRSDGGRVLALVVTLGDADEEANLDRHDAVQQIVDTVRARDGRTDIRVIVRPAASVARGILDAVRDSGADLVVLGVQAPMPGGVALGGVAEQVIDTADCDVLVYRRGYVHGLESLSGVTVGVDAGDDARVAARIAGILGQGLTAPVEAVAVRVPGQTRAEVEAVLDRALEVEERVDRRVVDAGTAAEGLRRHIDPTRLTVVGFHAVAQAGSGRLGRTTRAALDTLRGPVVAVSRPHRHTGSQEAVRRLVRRLRPRLTEAEERSLVWRARLDATTSTDFVVLCVVSAVLATLGLLLNSGAVIIGAMLVAPLMSPIVAFGTALVDGDSETLRRAAATTGVGAALVAGTAVVIGAIAGGPAPTSEMLSRGSPSLIDAGVAAASGVIGGYAGARKGIPAALAGVAIAAALVPPICVFGLAVTQDARLATGSGLLFITNIACIASAGAAVLLWLGVRLDRTGTRRVRYVRYTAPVVGAVLLALVAFGLSGRGPDVTAVQALVERELPGLEVVGIDDNGPAGTITVTGRAVTPPDAAAVDRVAQLVAEHHGMQLRIALQQVLVGSS